MKKYRNILPVILMLFLLLQACSTPVQTQVVAPTRAALGSQLTGAPEQIKIGIVVFLSGGAAKPFGLPAKDGAQAMIDSLNSGGAPAPYATPGIAGVPIEAVFVDEAGGVEKQVAEIKRLYEVEKVDLVIGYISSGDCLAVAPVAEELAKPLVIFDCGTSRLFEERTYQYVFRTNAHQAIDSIAGARYLLFVRPEIETIAGINQNYAWGQDSWSHFRDTVLKLKPDVRVVDEQFPKLGAEDYSAEIEALVQSQAELVHTSFWGADLENLVVQAGPGRLFEKSTLLMSVGEYALPDLRNKVPSGAIVGAHGPHGLMAPNNELNTWLNKIYSARHGIRPTYPVYHMAQALLGVKAAYEKAALQNGGWPSVQQVIQAFEYLKFLSPSGEIEMAIGKGHQAVEPAVYGVAGKFHPEDGEVEIINMVVYPPGCVNPPEGETTEQWIKEGFPGSLCQ